MHRLQKQLKNNKYECPICYNKIYRNQRIWHCFDCCFSIYHFKCIKEWSANKEEWQCPKCNHLYYDLVLSCWCGKQPTQNCGGICDKPFDCGHKCPLKCHPGPCLPCNYTNTKPLYCYCGKVEKFNLKCSDNKKFSCEQGCEKMLKCGNHKCLLPCHPGLCADCDKKQIVYCFCLSYKQEMICNSNLSKLIVADDYTRQRMTNIEDSPIYIGIDCSFVSDSMIRVQDKCSFQFDCNVHNCELPCHSTFNHPTKCPLDPSSFNKCPCGKSDLMRQSCTDPILCCSQICNKKLKCGHRCPNACHRGQCQPCKESTIFFCNCKLTSKEVSCGVLQFQCDFVCSELLDCRVHKCNKQCCPGSVSSLKQQFKMKYEQPVKFKKGLPTDPELQQAFLELKDTALSLHNCMAICNKKLKCGVHNCPYPCHSGPCSSCLQMLEINDAYILSCHCGETTIELPVYCGTELPPKCDYDCSRAQKCDHPKIPHKCHTDEVSCKPCTWLESTPCICKKATIHNIPCHQIQANNLPSCSKVCNEVLPCGAHNCKEICHLHTGDIECNQKCLRHRELCLHPCLAPCHGLSECQVCRKMVQIRSHKLNCTHNASMDIKCHDLETVCNELNIKLTPNDAGTSWRKSSPYFSVKEEDCCLLFNKLIERGYKDEILMDGVIATSDVLVNFDYLLQNYFTEDVLPLLQRSWVEQQIKELLTFKYETLPFVYRYKPMPRLKRKILHFIAESLNLYSYGIDKGPNRSICVERQPPNYVIDDLEETESRGELI